MCISVCEIQIHIKAKFQFQFVLRDTEKSGFLDVVNIGSAAITMETVIVYFL